MFHVDKIKGSKTNPILKPTFRQNMSSLRDIIPDFRVHSNRHMMVSDERMTLETRVQI